MDVTRRGFVVGCSAAIAALAGSRLNYVAFGSPEQEPNQELLLTIFLRGGCDGLNIVPPLDGVDRAHYEAGRNVLRIPASGAGAALPLGTLPGSAVPLGLHPAAAPLYDLYQAGRLAIVHAAGLEYDTRSHFDAMDYMERGTPGSKGTSSGWLTRHMESATNLPDGLLIPTLSAGSGTPTSLLGSRDTLTLSSTSTFGFYGYRHYADLQRAALRRMYAGSEWLELAGTQTLDAVDIIEASNPGSYTPAHGAQYPSGSFGSQLQVVAQLIKLQLGMRVATIDLGGWDTHDSQGNNVGGYFASLLGTLANGLAALYTDLDGAGSESYAQRLTVIVMSEFGRRLKENASGGTDHGHGNVMLVMGGQVNGGQLFGRWPGLANEQLYDGADLAITTDYRRVLSEILIRRQGNASLGHIFPGYRDYQPLGIVQGTDLEPIYTPASHELYIPLLRH